MDVVERTGTKLTLRECFEKHWKTKNCRGGLCNYSGFCKDLETENCFKDNYLKPKCMSCPEFPKCRDMLYDEVLKRVAK